ncbi:MAG: energy transducer TonB [Paludibacter sp.]|nr:energy transducer TonB [Paludibacter sp.]
MLLSKEIKLTSQQWCDYVFDNKNKEYGAYQMRRTSSKRHILAFLIVAAFTAVSIAVPAAIQQVRAANPQWQSDSGTIVITDIIDPKEPEQPKMPVDVPPPPKTITTFVFAVPTMVSSDQINDDNQLITQDEAKNAAGVAGLTANAGTSGATEHPDDILHAVPPIFDSKPKDDKIEIVPAHAPEFPGGLTELYAFVGKNLRYPEISRENQVQGTAHIRFVVEKDGSVSDITLLRGFDNACNKEALRVIQLMGKQKWVAGRDDKGNAVRAYFTIPITFKLSEK